MWYNKRMNNTIKSCSRCGVIDVPLVKYAKVKYKDREYQYYRCNPCNTIKSKKYRETEAGKAAVKRSAKKYEKKNKLKRKSWTIARCIPISPCVVCGKETGIDRHHPDSSKPMDVIFLCRKHHKEAHRNEATKMLQ